MITGLAMINEIEDRLGWRQTETLEGTLRSETRKLLRTLNRVLNSVQTLQDWPLLRKDGTLQLVPALHGTAHLELVLDSATVRLGASETELVFSEAMINRAVQFGAHATIYRVESVANPGELTLNRPWLGDTWTDADGPLAFKIVQDRYVLPQDFDRPTGGWENFFGNSTLSPMGPEAFLARRRARGSSMLIGDPEVFTTYGMDPSQTLQVLHFDVYPEHARVLTYSYQANHPTIETDQDRVLVPRTHEAAVIEGVLYLANRDYEDAEKTQLVLADFLRTLNTAQGSSNVAKDRPRITPRNVHRLGRRRQLLGGRRIDWGTTFDRSDRIGFN